MQQQTKVSSKIVLFDLDCTLCKESELSKEFLTFILAGGPKNWDAYHRHIPYDEPSPQVSWLYHLFKADGAILLVTTARSEEVRDLSAQWLAKHNFEFDEIFMRRDGDYRPDYIIKAEMLAAIRKKYGEPFLVLDDRQHVNDMFIREKVFTLDVGQGADRGPNPTLTWETTKSEPLQTDNL